MGNYKVPIIIFLANFTLEPQFLLFKGITYDSLQCKGCKKSTQSISFSKSEDVTKSLETAVRKMSRGSSPLFGSSPNESCSLSGLSGLAKGYEQYRESLTLLRPTTEYGEPSSDDLSSEWESSNEDQTTVITLKEPLATNLAINVVRRRKMMPPNNNSNSNSGTSAAMASIQSSKPIGGAATESSLNNKKVNGQKPRAEIETEEEDEEDEAQAGSKKGGISCHKRVRKILARACRVLMHKLSADDKGGRHCMSRFFLRGYLRSGRSGSE